MNLSYAPSRTTPVVLVPKNRGLAAQAARVLAERLPQGALERCAVRGEDVALLASEIARSGRTVLALTGDDLLDEWLAGGNALDPRLRRQRAAWEDRAAIYGRPTLCLIGSGPAKPPPGSRIRVAVCTRYRMLAERYLTGLASGGCEVERVEVQGSLESFVLHGVADYMIDIVVTGRTIREAGLNVCETIYSSDLAVLESP